MAQVILHPQEGRTARDYALMYIGLGWKVFPVWSVTELENGRRVCACSNAACDRPGKHPIADLVPGGLNDATSDRTTIERWWNRFAGASIGIVTGRVSGLTVVDADASGGKPGVVNLTALCAQQGGVPATFAVSTGGGGIHLYFKYSSALQTGTNVLAEAVDVRNDGGYVIAPPSLHILGSYKWRQDTAELLELPAWMRPAAPNRGRGRPRVRQGMRIEKVESLLRHVDPEDRDDWLNVGLILGRMYIGTPGETEAWALYESWSSRSEKFDEHRSENMTRMREMFYERSQIAPRAGQEPIGPGTLIQLARDGGWTPFGARVAVSYEPGNESIMCQALIEALTANRETNRFFNVSGEVRDVLRAPIPSVRIMQQAAERGESVPEALIVRRTLGPALQCSLSEVAVLATVNRNGEPSAKPIPETLVAMMLKDRARDFPSLSGIAEWPMVSPGTGEIIGAGAKGYDEATGLYFDIDKRLIIDEIPAEVAWSFLRDEMLKDFPFESDLHRAGALALLLCFMQRPMMKTCPAFAIVAPQPGTGKTTLLEVASLAVHGGPIVPHAYSAEDEEIRKALQALMMAKIPAVMFDNIGRGKGVYSDHLAKLITSETSADRVLGSSDMRKEVNTMLMTFTGNNIAFVRDMASRVVTLRLNARSADPLRRTFAHPDIRVWAMSNRGKILSALVSIAKLADGKRPPGAASRFEDYDLVIVRPVHQLLNIDVRELNATLDADAEEDEMTRDLLTTLHKWQTEWRADANNEPWRVSELVGSVNSTSMPEEALARVKRFAGTERQWEQDAVRVLGYALRSIKDDYKYAPFRLTARVVSNSARWVVENGT